MNFKIHGLLIEDAYERAVCHVSSWRSAYKGIVPDDVLDNLSVDELTEKFKKELETKFYSYYCAVYNGKIIGHFCFGKSLDEDKPNAGEVRGIYLIEEFWDKGYGKAMMNFAVNSLKEKGYKEIIVWVLEENHRARRFYEKCGFVFDGKKQDIIIGKPIPEIRYSLN
ncbi:MAG: GNAT family N-acetyltransferase [Oscillospiraceae bacterium]|nr:GNAT family N-acetyltransferase [Oscillospiraceae bacterium]